MAPYNQLIFNRLGGSYVPLTEPHLTRAINHCTPGPVIQDAAPVYPVTDFSMARTLNSWLELNFAVDNVLDKACYETLELYEFATPRPGSTPTRPRDSRLHPDVHRRVTIRLFPQD